MKFLHKIFGAPQPESPPAKKNPYEGFKVEHYPITGVYYATYKGEYLDSDPYKGIIELLSPDLFFYADQCRSEEAAWALIDKFREQQQKVNVRVITREIAEEDEDE